jgi:hypothetical protein
LTAAARAFAALSVPPEVAKRRVDLQVQLIRQISRMKAPNSETRDSVQLYLAPMRMLTEFGYQRAATIPTTLGLVQDNLKPSSSRAKACR